MSAVPVTPSVPWTVSHARTTSGGTAETLVLVGLILQVLGGALVIGGLTWFFGYSAFHPFPFLWAAIIGGVVVSAIVVLFLYFAYTLSYQRIRRGEYEAARTPTLVIGILSLFAGLIPGILYLIGYAKLDSAVREQQSSATGYAAFTPGSLVACKGCGRVYPIGHSAFCPACGQKMAA